MMQGNSSLKTAWLSALTLVCMSVCGCASPAYTRASQDIAGHRISTFLQIPQDQIVREAPAEAVVVGVHQRPVLSVSSWKRQIDSTG